jgi:choline-sulfatase
VGDFKYIDAPHPELYNLRLDRGELHNLIASAPSESTALRDCLNHLLASHPRRTEAAATAERSPSHAMLRSLGYLASGPGVKRSATGADAKDKLPEFQLYESAMLALDKGQMEKAAGLLRRIVAEDPGDTLARRDLGSIYFEQKQYAKARECLPRVLTTAPSDYVTNFELGLAASHLGLITEARGYLETACRLAPAAEQCRHERAALPKQANLLPNLWDVETSRPSAF